MGYGPETIYIAGGANGTFLHSVHAPGQPFQGGAVARLYSNKGLLDTLFLADIYQPGQEALTHWQTWSIDTVNGKIKRLHTVGAWRGATSACFCEKRGRIAHVANLLCLSQQLSS